MKEIHRKQYRTKIYTVFFSLIITIIIPLKRADILGHNSRLSLHPRFRVSKDCASSARFLDLNTWRRLPLHPQRFLEREGCHPHPLQMVPPFPPFPLFHSPGSKALRSAHIWMYVCISRCWEDKDRGRRDWGGWVYLDVRIHL